MTTPVLEPNGLQHFPHEHKDGQHSEAVFKELIHDFSSQRHSNAMRYLKMDKTATLQVPHPRLSLIPHQLLSETREVEQNHERRMLSVRAKSKEINMLLV